MATKQTSVNVQPVKGGSEEHNKREKQLDYVRKDLSHLNQYWESDTQANRLANIKALYQSKTGQKMTPNGTTIQGSSRSRASQAATRTGSGTQHSQSSQGGNYQYNQSSWQTRG